MSTAMPLPVMIIGAGPTGLSAALFLRRRGVPVRIIDKAARPSTRSKALLVNPRTLDLLRDSGVTRRIENEGHPVLGAVLHRAGRRVASIDLRQALSTTLPIGLGQAHTEALLSEALGELGVQVERGCALQTLRQDAQQVTLTLQSESGTQTADASLVFGADGAHSTVRQALDIDFPGQALPGPWQLWDLHLRTSLDPGCAHIVLVPDGFVFVMNLQDDLWRVIGNGADPLAHLPDDSVAGEVAWQSRFHIAHRLARRFGTGRVMLGGDAAHIHSPLGARGMNLGIEDAWVFAECAARALAGASADLQACAEQRRSVDGRVVRRVAILTRVMAGHPPPLRWLRDALLPQALKLAPVRHAMIRTLAGLDHPLRMSAW
jgi:2-polyprenyl-6-methoxyphenol hydroxylase-like FAD-dependent oxidoreductase